MCVLRACYLMKAEGPHWSIEPKLENFGPEQKGKAMLCRQPEK